MTERRLRGARCTVRGLKRGGLQRKKGEGEMETCRNWRSGKAPPRHSWKPTCRKGKDLAKANLSLNLPSSNAVSELMVAVSSHRYRLLRPVVGRVEVCRTFV